VKVKYKILYKNGFEDGIIQEESEEVLKVINDNIYQGLSEDVEGVLTFGDSKNTGYFIRLSDVSRVIIEIL
jgi:NurA-like 5'-3' nuclease